MDTKVTLIHPHTNKPVRDVSWSGVVSWIKDNVGLEDQAACLSLAGEMFKDRDGVDLGVMMIKY